MSLRSATKSEKRPAQRATYPPPTAYSNSKKDVTPFDLKDLFVPGELVNEHGVPNSLQGTKLSDIDSVAQWARLIALTLVENNSRLKQIEAEKVLLSSPNSQPKDPKRYSGGNASNRDPRRRSQEKKGFVQTDDKSMLRQIPRSVSADDIPTKQQEGISVVPDVNRLSLEKKPAPKPHLDGGRRLSQEQAKNNQEQRRSQELLYESKSDFRRLSQERKFERNNQEEARRSLEFKDKEREPDQPQQQQQQSDPRRLSFERKGKQDPRRLSQDKKQYYNQEQRKSWRVHRNELADIIFDVYADLDQKFPISNLRESVAILNLLPLDLRKFLVPDIEPQNNPESKTLRESPKFDKQCSLLVYSWLIPHCKNLMYDPQFKSKFFEDCESAEEGEQHTQIFLDVLETRFASTGWSPSPKVQKLMQVSDKYKQYWFLVVYGGQLHEGEVTKKLAQDYSDKILSVIEVRALMGISGEPANVSPSPSEVAQNTATAPFQLPFVKPEIYPRDTSDPVALNRNAIWYRWESSLRKSKNDRRAEIVDILEREFPTLHVGHKDSFNLGNQLKATLELLKVKGDASVLVKLNEAQAILAENPHFLLIPEVIHEHAKIPLESDKSFGRLYYSARDCLLSELFHSLQHNFPITTTTSSSSSTTQPQPQLQPQPQPHTIEKIEKTEKSEKQNIPEKTHHHHHIPPSKTLPSTPTNPPKKR